MPNKSPFISSGRAEIAEVSRPKIGNMTGRDFKKGKRIA